MLKPVGELSLKCGKETLIQNFIYSARWPPSWRNYLWGNTNTSSKQQVRYQEGLPKGGAITVQLTNC